jgi:hypothetical protein
VGPWRIALTLLALVGLARTVRAAEPTPIRIVFDKRAVCSNPEEFYIAIQSRNDHVRRANEGERAFGVRIRLKRIGANVRGELSVIHEQGETNPRAVEGASCADVVDALSLTAALAVDAVVAEGAQAADASQTASETAEPKPEPPPPPVQQKPDTAPEAVQPPPKPTRVRFGLGAQALVAEFVQPYVNVGGALVARLVIDTGNVFRPAFGIGFLHSQNDFVQEPGRAAVSVTAATLTACPWRLPLGPIAGVSPCALAHGGAVTATGVEVDIPRTASRSFWTLGGLLRADLEMSRQIAFELEFGLGAPLVERRFVTRPTLESAGKTPVVAPLASLGIVYIF